MEIRISHEFAMSEEDFFRHFFDREGVLHMYRDVMRFPEVDVKQEEDDARIKRTIVAIPKMEMPGAVAKILGSNFRYTEVGTFDRASKVFTWKTTPSLLADKIKNEGTMRVEVLGPRRIRRTAVIVLEAKVFGIGGMLESTFDKTLRDGWEKATRHFRGFETTS